MPVEVKVIAGTNLFYDKADGATREAETGDLNIYLGNKLIGSVKADHWTSWESFDEDAFLEDPEPATPFEEVIEEVDEYETTTDVGSDVDEAGMGDEQAE